MCMHFHPDMCLICPAHLILLDFITLRMYLISGQITELLIITIFTLLSLSPCRIQTQSLAPCSQTFSICVLLWHTHKDNSIKLWTKWIYDKWSTRLYGDQRTFTCISLNTNNIDQLVTKSRLHRYEYFILGCYQWSRVGNAIGERRLLKKIKS
jgi:hypothetical protein